MMSVTMFVHKIFRIVLDDGRFFRMTVNTRCDSSFPREITSENWSFERLVLPKVKFDFLALATGFQVIQDRIRAHRVKSRLKSGRSKDRSY